MLDYDPALIRREYEERVVILRNSYGSKLPHKSRRPGLKWLSTILRGLK